MGKYKFLKVANTSNDNPPIWVLVGDSEEIVLEHWNKYVSADIKEGTHQIMKNLLEGNKPQHVSNTYARAVDIYITSGVYNPMQALAEVENTTYNRRLMDVTYGITNYFPKNISILMPNSSLVVIRTITKDTLVYPDEQHFDLSDVRYINWCGGKHYYAKVGALDIVDEKGDQKWNTKEEAEAAAKVFVNNYNNSNDE